jgi:hypothetical protein
MVFHFVLVFILYMRGLFQLIACNGLFKSKVRVDKGGIQSVTYVDNGTCYKASMCAPTTGARFYFDKQTNSDAPHEVGSYFGARGIGPDFDVPTLGQVAPWLSSLELQDSLGRAYCFIPEDRLTITRRRRAPDPSQPEPW